MQSGEITVYWVTRLKADRSLLWKGPSAKPFQVFLMCIEGELEIEILGNYYRIEPGGIVVFRSDRIGPMSALTLPTEYQWASFYAPRAQRLPIRPNVQDSELLDRLFGRLLRCFQRFGGQSRQSLFWMEAILEALAEDEAALEPPPAHGAEDVIRTVIQQIDAHPQKCWSVEDLADRAGYSKTHFYRIFKQITGRSPQQYMIDARIDRAQSLLLETDLTIGQIARRLGYRSLYHFSRQFRNRSGLCPSAVRTSRS